MYVKNGKLCEKPSKVILPNGSTAMGDNISDEVLLQGGYFLYTFPVYDKVTQRLGEIILSSPETKTHEIINKTAAELQEETDKETASQLFLIEKLGARMFFRLCKILIEDNIIDHTDPRMAEIKTVYLKWKNLIN
jgi:hypothetical protein